jgi:hypothetical protein
MGLLADLARPVADQLDGLPIYVVVLTAFVSFLLLTVFVNVLSQILFKNPNAPPVVFHLFPIIGSTITYGIDPIAFFRRCREKVNCASPQSPSRC